MRKLTNTGLLLLIVITGGCSKLIDIDQPKNQLTTNKVFSDTNSAKSALLNIYGIIQNTQDPASNKYLSCYSDEALSLYDVQWNQSRVSPANGINQANWNALYAMISQCNMILEQMKTSTLPASFRTSMENEALFLRSYAYFYLVESFGDVPLLLSTDVNVNRNAPRTAKREIYSKIIADLNQAADLLPPSHNGSKTRANNYSAIALLARIYFYQENWPAAELLSTIVLESGRYTPLESTGNTFKIESKESILQLSTPQEFVTAMEDVLPLSPDVPTSFFFTDEFINSFEINDLRKSDWIGTNEVSGEQGPVIYSYPHKYKNTNLNNATAENLIILRAAEQYLIRAESRAHLDKLNGAAGAIEDLNVIRNRAGLPSIYPDQKEMVLEAIHKERRHEMFFENADRFLDLKRSGRLQKIMTAAKPTWRVTNASLPIPINEINYNSNLTQNEGY